MIWIVIGAIVVAFLIVMAVIASAPATEERGPMPKNHGGFGQSVHGGKS